MTEIWSGYILQYSEQTTALSSAFSLSKVAGHLYSNCQLSSSVLREFVTCTSLEDVREGGRGEEEHNSLPSKHYRCGCWLFLLQGRGWERRKERGRREGGVEWWGRYQHYWMLNALSPTKIDTAPFIPVTLAGYGSSQHCSNALMYTTHAHTYTNTHMITHAPAVAVSRTSWSPWCAHSAAFCWRKASSCWRFLRQPLTGSLGFCWGRKSESGMAKEHSFRQAKK